MNLLHKLGIGVLAIAAYYAATWTPDNKSTTEIYDLPEEITVESCDPSIPCHERTIEEILQDEQGEEVIVEKTENFIRPEEIDFSKKFSVHTEDYTFIKDKDWWGSRVIGQVMAMFPRTLLWDWDFGLGLDEERTRAALSMVENSEDVNNLTVRINHNSVIKDMVRLFDDPDVVDRNPGLARWTLGLYTALKGELWAELCRGDYYNSMTQTVVLYSNIESIGAHEMGHHEDFQRYNTDWAYGLARWYPPVKLYQEGRASLNARDIMAPEDKKQFSRYLIPAFGTYLLGAWAFSKKLFEKANKRKASTMESAKMFVGMNTNFAGGLGAYYGAMELGSPEWVAYGAFGIGMLATDIAASYVMKKLLPSDDDHYKIDRIARSLSSHRSRHNRDRFNRRNRFDRNDPWT